MELPGTRELGYAGNIGLADAAAGHDDDASGSLVYQLSQQGGSLERRGLLARREHALHAQGDELLERFLRSPASVKGTMEGDRDALGCIHDRLHQPQVDIAVGGEGSRHDAVDLERSQGIDVGKERGCLNRRIQEIAATGTHDDIELDIQIVAGVRNRSERGSSASLGYGGTEFYTVGASTLGCETTLD